MIKYGIGVQPRQVFTVVKVDEGSSNKRRAGSDLHSRGRRFDTVRPTQDSVERRS